MESITICLIISISLVIIFLSYFYKEYKLKFSSKKEELLKQTEYYIKLYHSDILKILSNTYDIKEKIYNEKQD